MYNKYIQCTAFILCVWIIFCSRSVAQKSNTWLRGGISLMGVPAYNEQGERVLTFSGTSSLFGVSIERDIEETYLSMEVGLHVVGKGHKIEQEWYSFGTRIKTTEEMRFWYIELPIWLKPRIALHENIDLIGVMGGYLGIGLRGREDYTFYLYRTGETLDTTIESQWSWNPSAEFQEARRYQIGHSLGIGIQARNVQLLILFSRSFTGVKENRIQQHSLLSLSIAFGIPYSSYNAQNELNK